MSRTIAIGDIHGCSIALSALLQAIDPQPDDNIVTIGDYIDRGPDSRGVLEQLLALEKCCRLVPLHGNHEEMLLNAFQDHAGYEFWMDCGGMVTLESYDPSGSLSMIPEEHIDFVKRLKLYHETGTHFFAHANYDPSLPLDRQDRKTLVWRTLDHVPGPHYSGKTAIVGHTPQMNHQILNLGYLKCIDTACGEHGLLTGLDVESGQVWQVDEEGTLRESDGRRA